MTGQKNPDIVITENTIEVLHRPGETEEEYIKRWVAAAPPFSEQQKTTIRAVVAEYWRMRRVQERNSRKQTERRNRDRRKLKRRKRERRKMVLKVAVERREGERRKVERRAS